MGARSRSTVSAGAVVLAVSVMMSACGSSTTEAEEEATSDASSESSEAAPSDDATTPSEEAETSEAPAEGPSEEDLDAYVAEAERLSRSSIGPGLKKLYSSIDIEPVYPSGIEYVFVYRRQLDETRARQELEKQASVLRSTFRTQIKPEMQRLGFVPPSATWTYQNPDGSEIWTITVP